MSTLDEKIRTVDKHISSIEVGDIVFHDGAIRTVGASDIKHGGFMGSTLFGDSYRLGLDPVKIVVWG